MGILIGILLIILTLLSLFMILIILVQRGNANGGMGAAMGGGAAEQAFGAETSSVLTSITRNVAIAWFVLVFGLYLAVLNDTSNQEEADQGALPEFAVPESGPSAPADVGSLLDEVISEAKEDTDAATPATE